MSDWLYEDRRAYRNALCRLSYKDRLEIEFHLLSDLKKRVYQVQLNFDKLGGQARMDSIELCIAEIAAADD